MDPADGAIYLLKHDNTSALLDDTLWSWRVGQHGKHSGLVWSQALSEITAERLYFMAMVADAANPAHYELLYYIQDISE